MSEADVVRLLARLLGQARRAGEMVEDVEEREGEVILFTRDGQVYRIRPDHRGRWQ